MELALRKIKFGKTELFLAVLWGLLIPWASGGKDPVAVLVAYFGLLLVTYMVVRRPRPAVLASRWLSFWALALVGWSAMSMVWSVNRYQSIKFVIFEVLALSVFGLAFQFNGQWERLRQWAVGYLAVASATSLVGWFIYVTGSYNRLTSIFYWANPFAIWLLPALLFAVWFFVTENKKLYLAAGVVVGAGFILTDSRSAYLILFILMVGILARVRLQPRAWGRLCLAGALIVATSLGVNLIRQKLHRGVVTAPGSRLVEAAKGESTSSTDRLYYLSSALRIWIKHPLLGTGAGTFGSVHPQYQLRVVSASSSAHNLYIQTLAEEGPIGLIALAGLVLTLLMGSWRSIKRDSRWWPVWLALLAMLVHLGLDIDSQYPVILALTATLAGLSYQPPKLKSDTAKKISYPGVMLGALVLVGYPVISLYQSQLNSTRGTYAQEDGNYREAAKYFDDAHQGLVYNPDVLTQEGINYFAQGNADGRGSANLALAKDRAVKASKLDPDDAQHRFLLARVLRRLGDKSGAMEAYQTTIKLDGYNNPDYYGDLVGWAVEQNQPEEAIKQANLVLNIYTDQVVSNRAADTELPAKIANIYAARANAYWLQGKKDLAAADLRHALKLNPINTFAKQLLSQVEQK